MVKICTDPYLRYGIFENYPGSENEMLVASVARLFNVSCESAKIRIQQLGLMYKNRPRSSSNFSVSEIIEEIRSFEMGS